MVTVATGTDALISQYYPSDRHPYRILESEGMRYVGPQCVVLDAGCGHAAPLLLHLAPHVARAIGVDVCSAHPAGIEYIQADLAHTGLPPESVDLVVSRSVLEHLSAPLDVFREIHRVLRPGGRFIFLTPNRWDYASLFALAIPNRLHPSLVRRLTDRKECDTFPTFYRANTSRTIRRLARPCGFEVESIKYLNQYPDYFRKIPPLFLLGVAYERLTTGWDRLDFLRGWILGTLVRGNRPQ
jgi:SAM-dependent methyltransferase